MRYAAHPPMIVFGNLIIECIKVLNDRSIVAHLQEIDTKEVVRNIATIQSAGSLSYHADDFVAVT